MMTTIYGVADTLKQKTIKFLADPKVQLYGRGAAYVLAGFGFSAAALYHRPMPVALGFVCGCSGTAAVLAAVGSIIGYLLFWGSAGQQCALWVLIGLGAVVMLGNIQRQTVALVPALAGLIVSGCGVLYQFWAADGAPVDVYLVRVALAGGSSLLFYKVLRRRDPILQWLVTALAVLALGQMSVTVWWNFGIFAGAILAVTGAFPAAALAGVALDLAGVSPVSMTAVFCAGYLVRFLPTCPRWVKGGMCAVVYMLLMRMGQASLYPMPPLVVGGLLGVWLPLPSKIPARRGETGVAQVRLEMAAGALYQTEQLLLEQVDPEVDEDAILQRAAQNACNGCSARAGCKDSGRLEQLPSALLHKPLISVREIPIICRKSGRFLAQLHRAQEQLRSIQADRLRREEYRAAVTQQYRFMGEYLQQLSDQLGKKPDPPGALHHANVEVFSNRRGIDSGDRCAVFAGVRDLQYVLLCDGMGTGMGAAQEGRTALQLLRRLLTAGYPATSAVRCLNSICALRSRAGAVTVDLLEIELRTGKAKLYKWGAAPSYLLTDMGAERIGVSSPPPGLSVTEQTELQYRLSLRRGERLVLVSDGIGQEEALHCCCAYFRVVSQELAHNLLRQGTLGGEDDATVIVVSLAEAE